MYKVDADIESAETLPSSFYRNKESFNAISDKLLSSSWQLVGDIDLFKNDNNVIPISFYEEVLSEPILLVKKEDNSVKCLSNVCTHRGNLLISEPSNTNKLLCGYHGRKFNLDGKFESMPEFEDAKDFPRICDHLTEIPLEKWKQFIFVSLNKCIDFSSINSALNERVGFLPIESFKKVNERCKDYIVKAHWALYCDNFLEGFHIPYVHPALNQTVDYGSYESVIYDYCNLQIGHSKKDAESFELPEGHIDYGKNVAAYYYWVFPNLMLNFYPWGLSVNIIQPIDHETTKVSFISYVHDETKIHNSAGALLDAVEMEDETIVQNVQKGIQSRFYSTGRFSPTKEKGVHHFHRLIAKFLKED